MPARKTTTSAAAVAVPAAPDALATFRALVATADVPVDSSIQDLDTPALERELTQALQLAHDRWGLGLLHMNHTVRVERGAETQVVLQADGRDVARLSDGAAVIAAHYEDMRAVDADDLSQWGVLPDGHRATLKGGAGQLRVLIEDARDFETHWTPERGGAHARTWRRGDTLGVELHRPASPATLLADAAWDAITSIKDRRLQRELMERSNTAGLLGALLGARHSGAERVLAGLPEAHFIVRSAVVRQDGPEGHSFDRHTAMRREAAAQLEELQKAATSRVAATLRHGLK